MTVSALIPTFNRRDHVRRAIDSVLAQTIPVNEIIVVDDGSTDGTDESVRARYGAQVRVVSQENKGVSAARRRAVHEASGDWVAFLDSDDEWVPSRNAELLSAATNVPENVVWIFGDSELVTDEHGCETLYRKFGLAINCGVKVFDDTWSVHYPFQFGMLQSSLIRRSALLEVDCFSEGLRHSEDFLVGVQVACRYRYAAVPTIVTRVYRTADLEESSIQSKGMGGENYYQARIKAFSLMAAADPERDWGEHQADSVRKLCKLLSSQGKPVRKLAAQQFRSSRSLKSVAFFSAAMLGTVGFTMWRIIGKSSRALKGVFA